ncbi:hypothetical protein WEI85_12465 [Actinomycetes bacterium KLBMP 9797]
MTDPDEGRAELRAVLDTSAMLSYARPHVHVGELISEIAHEDAFVGVPAMALVDAHARVIGDEIAQARLWTLVTLPAVRVLPLSDEIDAEDVASVVPLVDGDLARAQAVWEALDHDAYFVTTQPETAPTALGRHQIHTIPTDDIP